MTYLVFYALRCIYKKRVVDSDEFLDWLFLSQKSRICWIILFSFSFGFYLSIAVKYSFSSKQLPILLAMLFTFAYIVFLFVKLGGFGEVITRTSIREVPVPSSLLLNPCEIVYILRREDGVLKFGRTKNLTARLKDHKRDYRSNFTVLSSWIVFDSEKFEKMALDLTKEYAIAEDNRRELRLMSEKELGDFVLYFSNQIQNNYMEKTR